LTVYVVTFLYLLECRLATLYYMSWVSLTPFDLYYDIKNGIIKTYEFTRNKII